MDQGRQRRCWGGVEAVGAAATGRRKPRRSGGSGDGVGAAATGFGVGEGAAVAARGWRER